MGGLIALYSLQHYIDGHLNFNHAVKCEVISHCCSIFHVVVPFLICLLTIWIFSFVKYPFKSSDDFFHLVANFLILRVLSAVWKRAIFQFHVYCGLNVFVPHKFKLKS